VTTARLPLKLADVRSVKSPPLKKNFYSPEFRPVNTIGEPA